MEEWMKELIKEAEERGDLIDHLRTVVQQLRNVNPKEALYEFVAYLVEAGIITELEMKQQLKLTVQERNDIKNWLSKVS